MTPTYMPTALQKQNHPTAKNSRSMVLFSPQDETWSRIVQRDKFDMKNVLFRKDSDMVFFVLFEWQMLTPVSL